MFCYIKSSAICLSEISVLLLVWIMFVKCESVVDFVEHQNEFVKETKIKDATIEHVRSLSQLKGAQNDILTDEQKDIKHQSQVKEGFDPDDKTIMLTQINTQENSDSVHGDISAILHNNDNVLPTLNPMETETDFKPKIPSKKDQLSGNKENIPLREILLKLKPASLKDDEEQEYEEELEGNSTDTEEVEHVASGLAADQDTITNSSVNNHGNSKRAVCSSYNQSLEISNVQIINATLLLKQLQSDTSITSRSVTAPCHLIYFFSPYCPFSVAGSAYVNAMARSLPNIPVYGVDSVEYHYLNARYGVMGTPTLLLFHNGNGAGRYNASEYSVSSLMAFINHFSDQPITNINVTSSDFQANLPSKLAESPPYFLSAAWTFLVICGTWLFLTSRFCARLTEAFLNNWREAEAQHDHQD